MQDEVDKKDKEEFVSLYAQSMKGSYQPWMRKHTFIKGGVIQTIGLVIFYFAYVESLTVLWIVGGAVFFVGGIFTSMAKWGSDKMIAYWYSYNRSGRGF